MRSALLIFIIYYFIFSIIFTYTVLLDAYLVNVDNKYLLEEIRKDPIHVEEIKQKFIVANVIIGLSLMKKEDVLIADKEVSLYDVIGEITSAISSIIIPLSNTFNQYYH